MSKATVTIETVHAGWIDPSLPAPQALRRVDGQGQRFYYTAGDDVKVYPSVTSIIRATMPMPSHLLKWWCDLGFKEAKEILSTKAAYGTLYHILCGELLQKGSFDLDSVQERITAYVLAEGITFATDWWDLELQRDLLAFAQFCAEKDVRPLAIEVPLLSEKLGYAGAIDLACELTFNRKTVRAIVDMKSGKGGFYEDYEIQLEAYRQLWNDQYPDLPVAMIFNFSPKDWRKAPTYDLKNQTESANAYKWPLLLSMYQQAGESKPKPLTKVSGVITLGRDVSDLFEVVEIEEHLRRIHAGQEEANLKEAADVDTF